MPKDLNETIDALFRGVVFIIYDFVQSLIRIAVRPVRGTIWLVARLRAPNTRQIGPYVFLFIHFFVGLSMPRYLSAIANFYEDDFPSDSLRNPEVRDAYINALDIFEPKLLLATTFSCILMTVVLDAATSLYARSTATPPRRRALVKTGLLYISGYQIFVITCAIVMVFYFRREWAWNSFQPYQPHQWSSIFLELVATSLKLEYGWTLAVAIGVYSLGACLFAYALVQPVLFLKPFLVAHRLGQRIRRLPRPAAVVLTGCLFAALTVANFDFGSWVIDEIKPAVPEALTVSQVACTLKSTDAGGLTAIAVIDNPTTKAIRLDPGDTEIWVVAELTPEGQRMRLATAPPFRRSQLKARSTFMQIVPAVIQDTSQGAGRPGYLMAPGQSIWVESVAKAVLAPPKYPEDGAVHCALALPNFEWDPSDGHPIAAYGSIVKPGGGAPLNASDLFPNLVISAPAPKPDHGSPP